MKVKNLVMATVALSFGGQGAAWGQTAMHVPLPPDHPLIGTWRVEVPSLKCFEVYEIRQDGTTRVTSAKEIAESEFEISVTPGPKGFYKWIDKVVKNNGQPDCSGESVPTGDVAVNFIILRPAKDQFLMCQEENLNSCLGPFVRLSGT